MTRRALRPRPSHWLVAFFWLCLGAFSASPQAAEIGVHNQKLEWSEEGYVLSADFAFDLNSRLEDAVNRGLVLTFVADFQLERERWYWLDEKLARRSLSYRLSYHALTRQYRLSRGVLHQSFDSLDAALAVLRRLRNWLVIEHKEREVTPGNTYQAMLRLRLDTTQLPRPFQLSALGNKEWTLGGDWKTWMLKLPEAPPLGSAAGSVAGNTTGSAPADAPGDAPQ